MEALVPIHALTKSYPTTVDSVRDRTFWKTSSQSHRWAWPRAFLYPKAFIGKKEPVRERSAGS